MKRNWLVIFQNICAIFLFSCPMERDFCEPSPYQTQYFQILYNYYSGICSVLSQSIYMYVPGEVWYAHCLPAYLL